MPKATDGEPLYDLMIIGGGINGCGIARDAAGRGLSVALAEMNDLAWATSSASTKLFHGGLRYLEYFEFRLVREALIERERLLRAMPHISWPMRFVLPYGSDMRFDTDTPASRLVHLAMPWLKGRRPAWMIRFGLFLYDHLGGRKLLPPTSTLDLATAPEGAPLQDRFAKAYEYSDCWVEDSRLVALNARDAAERGADIMVRTEVVATRRAAETWEIELEDAETGTRSTVRARCLINAGGPWVGENLREKAHLDTREDVRLVRGSHIVTRRLYDHDKAYFLQGTDGRIIFTIPYERDFTLIGTTDKDHPDPETKPECTPEERDYLCRFVSAYFKTPIGRDDIVWSYSGVHPLYDDCASAATAATRDYTLKLDSDDGAPILNVFGGKITTYRRLAESALAKIAPWFTRMSDPWTAEAALPGGDFPVDGVDALKARVAAAYPFLDGSHVARLVRAYGTDALDILGEAREIADLGRDFGATMSEREVTWLMEREFARTAQDVVWRRSKLGLRMSAREMDGLEEWMRQRRAGETSHAAQ